MPAWNGLVGPNALPTIAAPALIATTVTASMRRLDSEQQQRGHEGNDLLLHVLERAHGGEKQRHDRDHQQTAAGERANERADDGLKRAEPIDHDPRAADEQHDGHDLRGSHEAAWNGDERPERADGRRLHGVIGAGDDDAPAGVGVVAAIVLARGQNPRQGRGHGDRPAEKHDRMRKTE